DQLLATLDTLTRKLRLESGTEVVLSDTVGFVRDLPHSLVEAFTATLEQTAQADLLLHVVDASAPDRDAQIAEVERVLGEIGAADVPRLTVMNKIDAVGLPARVGTDACGSIDRLWVSAVSGDGIDALRNAIEARVGQWRTQRFAPPADAPHEAHPIEASAG